MELPRFRLWVFLGMGLVLIQNGYNIYEKVKKEKIADLWLGKIDRSKFLTA